MRKMSEKNELEASSKPLYGFRKAGEEWAPSKLGSSYKPLLP